ncbi:hypothetical protein [Asaia sp. HN010]|uniref:hypothetical protein n=1 Tax=Asaia sp. HN010 TaxID=3081233 RepID=UPI003018F6C3
MPTLTINGRSVTVDDSFLHLSPEQQDATVDEIAHSMGGQEQQEAPGIANGTTRAAATGMPVVGGLLNRGDALIDATASYALNPLFSEKNQLRGGFGDRYQQALDVQNGMDRQFAQDHPIANTAAQVAGAVGSSIPFAGVGLVGRTGLGAARGVVGALARAGATAGEGAAVGGADAWARGDNIGTGAALGTVGGAAGSAIGDGLGAAIRAFRPASSRAREIVAQLAEHDGITPQSATDALTSLGDAGMLADLGSNLQQGTRAVASAPGSGQRLILDALMGRAESAGARITRATDREMGPRTNVLDTADSIARDRAAAARPLYKQAYAANVPMTDDLQSLLSRPSMETALRNAQRLAADSGEAFDQSAPTVMGLDYTKRALDDAISSHIRAGNNNEARILMQNREALLGHMDDAVPAYAEARRVFSGYSGIANALQDGQSVFKSTISPDMIRRQVANMPEDQLAAYMEGARQQIANTMGTARNDANAARAMFDKGNNREKLAAIMGDEPASRMLGSIDSERQFSRTLDQAQGGSRTDRNILAQQIVPGSANIPVLRSLLNMRFGDAAEGVLQGVGRPIVERRNDATRREIAALLSSRDTSFLVPTRTSILPQRLIAASLIGTSTQANGR